MSSVKQVTVFGLLGLSPETSGYGSGGTLAPATNGMLLAKEALMKIHYADMGARALAAASGAPLPRNVPSGSWAEAVLESEFKGLGSAYSVSVTPPNEIHTGLLMAGYTAAFSTTPTPQWTYTPQVPVPTYNSGTLGAYSRGQLWTLTGVYSDFEFDLAGPGEVYFKFPVKGILAADPTEVALPAITYLGNTVLPPKANSVNLAIGTWSAGAPFVRKITGKLARKIDQRVNINGSGFGGFGPGRYAMTLDIDVEAAAFATFNPYSSWRTATAQAVSFTVGAAQYNKFKFTAPQARIIEVTEGAEGATAIWTLHIECNASTPTANDDHTILIN